MISFFSPPKLILRIVKFRFADLSRGKGWNWGKGGRGSVRKVPQFSQNKRALHVCPRPWL